MADCFHRIPAIAAPIIGVIGTACLFAALPAFGQQGGLQAWSPQSDPAAMAAGPASVRNERLVPAAMNVITDKLGNSWNIEQNGTLGRVGNSMINSGLTLLVNNQQFYSYQPMMTADGAEYVLPSRANSSLPGLQILRRIKVMDREGALRFLEVLTNGNSNPITISVVLRTNFSGNYKTYLTDQGNSGVVTLGPREGAILVTPGSNQSNRAFLFTLSDQKSAIKPAITSQNKYGLTFQYNLTIPPGQTVAIAHAVAQVPVPRAFDRQTLARVFRPLAMDRLAGTVPQEFRPLLVNGDAGGGLVGDPLRPGPSLESRLGVERGRRDILAMGDRTRLVGAAAATRIAVTTPYGEAEVPLEQIAAIVGGNGGRRDGARIYLRDSQAFSGAVTVGELRFAMASGGRMNLQIESLDRLVFAKSDSDGQWTPETIAMVETHAGDRLAATRDSAAAVSLRGMTPWGPLNFSLEDIAWLSPMEDEPVGHFVEFKNGTRCFLFLSSGSLPLQSSVFGACELETGQIRAIVTRAAHDRALAEREGQKSPNSQATDAVSSPHILAAGGQRIVGAMAGESLQVLTQSETVAVAPQEIRRMINLTAADGLVADAGGPYFRLELWGGGVLAGYLAQRELELEVRGAPWRMPLADVRELVTPVPHLTEAAQQDIARLIKALGDDLWQTREKATEELQGFGFLAQSILREELKTNSDPEVRRRLERVLAGID